MPDEGWSWSQLGALIPTAASAFAFAFVVGYFYAFDIAWFPFFSLSEHLVFALRALPIAIGASVGLLVALERHRTDYRARFILSSFIWIVVLLAAAVWMLITNHLGTALSFGLMAFAIVFFRARRGTMPVFAGVVLLIANMMIASVMIGYVSGSTWRLAECLPQSLKNIVYSRAIEIRLHDKAIHAGHVVFAGADSVLFYEFNSRVAHLYRRQDIDEMYECFSTIMSKDTVCSLPGYPPSKSG